MHAEIKVAGIVQGVGFRPFIYRLANENNLSGYIRNLGDAGIEIVVEGRQKNIECFLEDINEKKPPLSRIHKTIVHYTNQQGNFTKFEILKSAPNRRLEGSIIPPDIAICTTCLKELRNPRNPRHDYFFITCTDCGPRYTTIQQLPYDRQHTTMQEFVMCRFCAKEYKDPKNRRFHAQTVACPKCGPQAYLTTNEGQPIPHHDPIREAGRLLEKGYILALKGYGGFHIATATTKDEPLLRLRQDKHRSEKPFAIMARNLETIREFATVSPEEAEVLASHAKPIVLLEKTKKYFLSELISPALHNIGVMLPYTGLHVLLFDQVREPAYVMTSANPPNEPIVTDNAEALKRIGSQVDYFLFHNRQIAQRCDDSVLRLHNKKVCFIRRSRGYVPEPIKLKQPLSKCTLGIGAEENVTACILLQDKAFVSQYVGDVKKVRTYQYLEKVVRHLVALTNAKISMVACDLHPRFATTKLAQKIAAELSCQVLPVQHHHAHTLSLMGEHSLDEIIGIACDGYGYGADGRAWGGEVLHCSKNGYRRVGRLQEQPLIGGDLATRYPLRMAAGILSTTESIEKWLQSKRKHFRHGELEIQTMLKMLDQRRPISTTTSCGRILDAVSAILNICYERTYQGEPAMKLESAANRGSDVLKLEPKIERHVLDTTHVVRAVFEAKDKVRTADLAYSTQSYLAKGLAHLAVEAAQKTGVKKIGCSGGVAYNKQIVLAMKDLIEKNHLEFHVHEMLPPGDGGISFGQALAAVGIASKN
ncbi:MAG: carbamoyltransferase HypF [Candidatus Bathyarchaeota archaeon]|nr:MAG: carbamoyltransferase HypF [Candidatus Bathyarchaeota archaeon]